MEPAKSLVINVVTWNSARFLPDLFESLDRQTSRDFTVTVVDNASTDGTLAWLAEYRPDVTVLRNFRNQGFSRAHNQAIALALARWDTDHDLARRTVFVLNPDIILHPDCVRELIAFMDAHPNADMCGPKLLRAVRVPSETGERDDIEQTNVIDSTGLVLRRTRQAADRGAGEEDRGQYDAVEPFGVSGAALALRASAIPALRIGDPAGNAGGTGELFDEDFFAYKEDVDLCWRLRLLGRSAAFVPQAVAWHHRAARPSARRSIFAAWKEQRSRPPLLQLLSFRNQLWLEWKNDEAVNRLIHLPWILAAAIVRLLSALTNPTQIRATAEAWLGRGKIRAKRKEMMARRRSSAAEIRKWMV